MTRAILTALLLIPGIPLAETPEYLMEIMWVEVVQEGGE